MTQLFASVRGNKERATTLGPDPLPVRSVNSDGIDRFRLQQDLHIPILLDQDLLCIEILAGENR